MNHKANKILSVYWFAILAIVAIGIVLMVSTFYGKPFDVRANEGEIMINKIVDCLSDADGKLRQDISNENFLQECSFVLTDEFYLEVEGLAPEGVPFEEGRIEQGNSNLKDFCELRQESVVCVEKNIYEDGNTIKILSAISK